MLFYDMHNSVLYTCDIKKKHALYENLESFIIQLSLQKPEPTLRPSVCP